MRSIELVESGHEEILAQIEGSYRGLILYGSYARGDERPESDIDVLQLVNRPRPFYQKGQLSVSVYTEDHLRLLAEAGSLFILHLVLEGRVISDQAGALSGILAAYRNPESYESLRGNLRIAASILDVNHATFQRYPAALIRLALYLLRTELYIRCCENGKALFSVNKVAQRLNDPRITNCFGQRVSRPNDYQYFVEIRQLTEEYLATRIHNEFLTIEAFAVNTYQRWRFASELALRVLSGQSSIDYENLLPEVVGL